MRNFAIISMVSLLAACSSAPKEMYERRAWEDNQRREALAERAVSQAPKWMTELPASSNAVYANGTAVSGDFSMADTKAKLVAYSKICMAAGGRVSQTARVFLQDSNETSIENSEQLIQSLCPSVDITGVEIREVKRIHEGGRFRSYVLVALPTGDANRLQQRKDRIRAQERAATRAEQMSQELQRQQ